jgi:hypothetical protein
LTIKKYKISKEKVKLSWGGEFEFDVVVKDENSNIIELHCLSIAEAKTEGGNGGSGKFNKIKADALMLLGAKCGEKILAFTGKTMYEKTLKEIQKGRFPNNIKLKFIDPKSDKEIETMQPRHSERTAGA